MTAVIDCKDLDSALRAVKPACGKARTLPVLAGVRLAFRGSRMTLETTDLDRSITLSVPLAESGSGRGETVVPLLALQSALKHRQGLVELNVGDDGSLEMVAAGSCAVVGGQLSLKDWPKIIEPASARPVKVTEAMAEGIKKVAKAASREDSRPILTGVQFEGGYIVATDSYRLAVAGPFQPMEPMLVPADPLLGAIAVGAEMTYDAQAHKLMVLDGAKESILHCIEGQYPSWRQLDIRRAPFTVRFSRAGAIAALKRCEVAVGPDNSTPVRMSRDDDDHRVFRLEVFREGRRVLSEKVAGVGELPGTVAFNPTYFRQGVEACTGQSVEMWFVDSLKPAKLIDGFFSYLLMPVRVA